MDQKRNSFENYRDQFYDRLKTPPTSEFNPHHTEVDYITRWEEECNLILQNEYECAFIIPKMIIDYAASHGRLAFCGIRAAYSLVAYGYGISWVDPFVFGLDPMWLYGFDKDRAPFLPVFIPSGFESDVIKFLTDEFSANHVCILKGDDETVADVTYQKDKTVSVVIRESQLCADTESYWKENHGTFDGLMNKLRDNKKCRLDIDPDELKTILEKYMDTIYAEEKDRDIREKSLNPMLQKVPISEEDVAAYISKCESGIFRTLEECNQNDIQVLNMVPHSRDQLYQFLADNCELAPKDAYYLTEDIRKGKGNIPSVVSRMNELGIEAAYQELLKKIPYLKAWGSCFPKARMLLLLSQKAESEDSHLPHSVLA